MNVESVGAIECLTPVPRLAPAPFDDPRAEVILRTSDDVDFRVFRIILELASPVFKDMILRSHQSEGADGSVLIPVIPVSERSAVLNSVLRFCYPVDRLCTVERDVSAIAFALQAAFKYDIKRAIHWLRWCLSETLSDGEENAVKVYAVACSLRLEREARAAALASIPWPPAADFQVPELAYISGADCYALHDYSRRACEAISKLFKEDRFTSEICAGLFWFPRGMCPKCTRPSSLPTWWTQTKSVLEKSVMTSPLDPHMISLAAVAPIVLALACDRCKNAFFVGWETTRRRIAHEISETVEKVDLVLPWNEHDWIGD